MKNLMTSLCLLVLTLGFGQTSKVDSSTIMKNSKIKDIGVRVEVDSAEDLENSFKIEDLKDLLFLSSEGQDITLEIVCNSKIMPNGVNSSLTLKINGNTNKEEEFLRNVNKIRNMALKHFNSREN